MCGRWGKPSLNISTVKAYHSEIISTIMPPPNPSSSSNVGSCRAKYSSASPSSAASMISSMLQLLPFTRKQDDEHNQDQEEQEVNIKRQYSVGIFIDLDNMSETVELDQTPLTREKVASVVRPFQRWIATMKDNLNKKKIAAFANQHTTKRRKSSEDNDNDLSKRERQLQRLQEQEYWNGPVVIDDYDDAFDDVDHLLSQTTISNAVTQTGYDENGVLRCGVCGAKIKLTKKDRARGWDEYDKLNKHMKGLHDNEQRKRKLRVNQLSAKKKRKLAKSPEASKLIKRIRKYDAAQVGLGRNPSGRNDLFPILKEEKVECVTCNDVDSILIQHTRKWFKNSRERKKDEEIKETVVVTMVVSEDSDFKGILKECNSSNGKKPNNIAVSATWRSATQTQALVIVSDIVITRAEDGEVSRGRPLFIATAVTAQGESLLKSFPF
jgi:hypothetical protein